MVMKVIALVIGLDCHSLYTKSYEVKRSSASKQALDPSIMNVSIHKKTTHQQFYRFPGRKKLIMLKIILKKRI